MSKYSKGIYNSSTNYVIYIIKISGGEIYYRYIKDKIYGKKYNGSIKFGKTYSLSEELFHEIFKINVGYLSLKNIKDIIE